MISWHSVRMLGPSHALSGAAAWLAASYTASEIVHYHQTPVQIAVGTAICAGGALIPDLDMSGRVLTDQGGATVAHTFGVVSLFAAECMEKLSLGIYDVTRTRRDPHRHNGHRTFTHTLVFNAALGYGVYEALTHWGKPAVLVTLFLCFAFALRGLLPGWEKRAGFMICTAAAAGITWWAAASLPAHHAYPLLGAAVGAGGVVHLLGDMLTSHGCPIFWPVPIAGKTWYDAGVPHATAVKVGGKVEVFVLRPLFFIAAVAAVVALCFPWAYDRISHLRG